MTSSWTADQLIEDYKAYLAAFNAKSLSEIKEHLSPECTAYFQGKLCAESREDMLPTYTAHWEKWPTPVELLDIRAIESGVWTLLRDWDNRKDVEVEYIYNDKNLQIRHNIKEPIPFGDDILKKEVAADETAAEC